jgi:anti-sigma factor ChrR (cupin superfamily)
MGVLWTCAETAAALTDYEEGILPLALFLKVRTHLFNCPGCRTLRSTLRVVPPLAAAALAREPADHALAQRALDGFLARLAQPPAPRPWPGTPVPAAAQRLLEAEPDLPLRILAATHEVLARSRAPFGPPYPLPPATLESLPPPEQWAWQEGREGDRQAELFADTRVGLRLLLVYAPPSLAIPAHRHLGSESILVLDGSMADQGLDLGRGGWVHHEEGSCHAPRVAPSGCWCLVREEGPVRYLGPAGWLRNFSNAS